MPQTLEQKITQLADQCVKCGMCLPVCPTYQINKNENESPRGRIALMQGIVQGDLSLTTKVKEHLDHCVGCLSCENICPSTVKYETLIDSIREYTVTKQSSSKTEALISFLIKPSNQKLIYPLLRFYQLSGLQKVIRSSGLIKIIGLHSQEKLLPKLIPRLKLKSHYPSSLDSLGCVALFTGCMGNLFEQKAIRATIQVLNAMGYDVEVPTQVCCGALHQHSGYSSQAEALTEKNRKSFIDDNDKYQAIIFTASGCGALLKSSLVKSSLVKSSLVKSSLKQSELGVTSILQFIEQHLENHSLKLNEMKYKGIALHQPCSLKNSLKEDAAVINVLGKIPQLKINKLESQCCGAAGKNMLTQTDIANQIRQPLLEQIKNIAPEVIVSSNIGCALHLQAGVEQPLQVIHPIELVAMSLLNEGASAII